MIDAQFIAEALGGKRLAKGFLACCPAHDDHHPSLSIDDGDNGRPVVHCNAGCSQEAVIAALREKGLWPEGEQPHSREELEERRTEHANQKKAREEAERVQQAHAATKARQRWESARPANPAHPYLAKKHIQAHGIRQEENNLIIPLRDESGAIWALQTIDQDGGKLFSPAGCRTKGLYYSIGNPTSGGPVCIVEGFATGAAIHEAASHPVACAMTAGNLEAVARIIKAKLPNNPVILCADDDQKPGTDKNFGIEAATRAAMAIGGRVAVPDMGKKSDFCDAWNECGAAAVRREIEAAALVTDQQHYQEEAPEELAIETWPIMDNAAFHGVAGDFVKLACRSSEADPAAVLATFLVRFGVECGQSAVFHVGDTKHYPRLAAVVVGASSKARKGTSGKPVKRLFDGIDGHATASSGPFSSGEGIVYAVRDPLEKWDEKNACMVTVDPGVTDKRLFVLDEEFSGVLANTKREGNTLSMIIRCAWDDGNISPLTKTSKTSTTGAHVGWVSHITMDELLRKLNETEALNGFGNRILWVCSQRAKEVPIPEPMPLEELAVMQRRVGDVLTAIHASGNLVMQWSEAAKNAWVTRHYTSLTKDKPGLVGCLTNRAEAQVIRLAMIYALLDGGAAIEEAHLNAALAFWGYCEQSARFIFHGRMEDTTAQTILEAVQKRDLTSADIHALFKNHLSKSRMESALSALIAGGHITTRQMKSGKGRPPTIYHFQETSCELSEKSELNTAQPQNGAFNSHNSLFSQDVTEKNGWVEGVIE